MFFCIYVSNSNIMSFYILLNLHIWNRGCTITHSGHPLRWCVDRSETKRKTKNLKIGLVLNKIFFKLRSHANVYYAALLQFVINHANPFSIALFRLSFFALQFDRPHYRGWPIPFYSQRFIFFWKIFLSEYLIGFTNSIQNLKNGRIGIK